MTERDRAAQEEVAARTCPRCGAALVPRLPRDPTRVFIRGGGVRWEGHCPEHGRIE